MDQEPAWVDPCSEEGRKAAADKAKADTKMELKSMAEAMEPEDSNYKYRDLILQLSDLRENMPQGWTMRSNPKKGEALYVHENGKESWKHPNTKVINELMAEYDARAKAAEEAERVTVAASRPASAHAVSNDAVAQAKINKLRKMLQKGLPEAAVAQRARLEGIDMVLVLQKDEPSTVDEPESSVAGGKRSRSDSFGETGSPNDPFSKVSPRLIKKYKNMLKRGVALAAVQQMAFVESQLQPNELLQVCDVPQDGDGTAADAVGEGNLQYAAKTLSPTTIQKDPMRKYKAMIKSGVPALAVEQTALRDGIDASVIVKELGVTPSTEPAKPVYFTAADDNKSVDIPKETDLSKVVIRMVQTVQRAAGTRAASFHYSKQSSAVTNSTIRVSTQTLYNALGALQGVQWAIDKYNGTTTFKDSWLEAKAKRQAYAEMATSLGLPLPPSFRDTVGVDGLSQLIAHVKEVHEKELRDIQTNCQDRGLYDFDSLAFLYTPGSRVLAKHAGGGGVDMICQVVWNRYEQGRTIAGQVTKYFRVCFQFIVAVSGSHFTIAEVVEGIQSFEGTRSISTLNFIPFSTFPAAEQDRLIAQYRARGEMYNRVATGIPTYMEYDKNAFFLKRGGGLNMSKTTSGNSAAAAMATGGRVMIDTQGAYDHGHSISTGYETMVTAIKHKYKEYKLHLRSVNKDQGPGAASFGGNANNSNNHHHHHDGGTGIALLESIPDDHIDLVWPAVVGFSFTSKAWGDVLIDSLSSIQFQDDIFDRLVLPPSRKRIVKALIRNGNTEFQDVIQGKGEGSVFLLYGPPGVGKTLTAEAVCEVLHKPLYSVSLGQLGTTPGDLETNLGEILNLCARWDALILLDEADIFLEKRTSTGSLERNAMVSVMLRLVEYFQGILFLTSNRVDSLDPAFQTRITLALRYDNLDRPGRAQIWKNLLEKSGYSVQGGAVAAQFDPHRLAEAPLNGREIKNCIRMGLAMAAEEGKTLSQQLLLETVETVRDLNEQMNMSKDYYNYDGSGRGNSTKKKKKGGLRSFFSRKFSLGAKE